MEKESKVCNIRPADRIEKVGEYYFSKKLKEVAGMIAAGKRVISLGVGGPDRQPTGWAIDAFCDALQKPDVHGYQPYNGIPELRKWFAKWYEQWYGITLDPKTEILPLIGSKEGIFHISLAFLNPGDGVLVPNPGYPTYTSVSRLVGADLVSYQLDEKNGWYPDFDELERILAERQQSGKPAVKLMWVNYPNMPTGADATDELFDRLVAFGMANQLIICNDNPYSSILNDHPRSILSSPGAKEICIELNSMSKSHNMPGWRVGMLASNPQFVQWVLKVKSNVDSGQLKPLQLAAVTALKTKRYWFTLMNEQYRERRIIAEQIMDSLGCTYDKKQVGLFLWGKIPDHIESSEWLTDKILYDAHVFIVPGSVFGSAGERYIRISLCCPDEKFAIALNRIKKLNIKMLHATSLQKT